MSEQSYSTTFTVGSLFHSESVRVAELYLELHDWNVVRDRVIEENVLQSRTMGTLVRVCREIISRLRTLAPSELQLLVEGSHHDQANLLWLAVCRRYRLIADFAVEVLRERFITLKFNLTYEDFDSFFNRKSEWRVELDQISPVTRGKVRQVLFKMLREADLLTVDNTINAAMLSPGLMEMIKQGSDRDLLFFPVHESEMKEKSR